MPRLVFSDGLEEKLTALWVEYQTKKSGVMMKRAKKEIAEKLNLYAKEIGENMEFSPSVVHNKIDNLKSKAKDHYKKFRRATATGSAVDPTSDEAFDLQQAYTMWTNFRTSFNMASPVPRCSMMWSAGQHFFSFGDRERVTFLCQRGHMCTVVIKSRLPLSRKAAFCHVCE